MEKNGTTFYEDKTGRRGMIAYISAGNYLTSRGEHIRRVTKKKWEVQDEHDYPLSAFATLDEAVAYYTSVLGWTELGTDTPEEVKHYLMLCEEMIRRAEYAMRRAHAILNTQLDDDDEENFIDLTDHLDAAHNALFEIATKYAKEETEYFCDTRP